MLDSLNVLEGNGDMCEINPEHIAFAEHHTQASKPCDFRQYYLRTSEQMNYFAKEEGRDPTITEIRVVDTYWSDHCRHTTFLTTIDSADIDDEDVKNTYDEYIKIRAELGRTKPINLMDIATIGARYLKVKGKLPKIDESTFNKIFDSVRFKTFKPFKSISYLLAYPSVLSGHAHSFASSMLSVQ